MQKSTGFLLTLALVAAASLLPVLVLADGMVIDYNDSPMPVFRPEVGQQAFINYEEGLEKLIISIETEDPENRDAVWLFPVPADPNQVVIDVVDTLPRIFGTEISQAARSSLSDALSFMQLTQIYTIPSVMMNGTRVYSGSTAGDIMELGAAGAQKAVPEDVVVYEHLEKSGITTEIISAQTADGLYDYLKNKGLNVKAGTIPVLDGYIGKKYSFVASWLTAPTSTAAVAENEETEVLTDLEILDSVEEFYANRLADNPALTLMIGRLQNKYPEFAAADNGLAYLKSESGQAARLELFDAIKAKPELLKLEIDRGPAVPPRRQNRVMPPQHGIFVTFPTAKMYFPLLPTSVYESREIPIEIRIIGFVTPEIPALIKSYVQTDYYSSDTDFRSDVSGFLRTDREYNKYTKIMAIAPSKYFKEDLWLINKAPLETGYQNFIANHPAIVGFTLLIIISIFTGLLVGLICFKELRRKWLKLALFGLSNCLSLLALALTIMVSTTKAPSKDADKIIADLKGKGYLWRRRLIVALLFITVPLVLIDLLMLPLIIGSINDDLGDAAPGGIYVMYIIALILIIAIMALGRIKTPDQPLFDQLKAIKYSDWTFKPADKMKLIYILAYSVVFLLISWLSVWLLISMI